MYYAKREDNFVMRSLKYARKYLHVEAMFWGPVTTIGTGFVALQNITDRLVGKTFVINLFEFLYVKWYLTLRYSFNIAMFTSLIDMVCFVFNSLNFVLLPME